MIVNASPSSRGSFTLDTQRRNGCWPIYRLLTELSSLINCFDAYLEAINASSKQPSNAGPTVAHPSSTIDSVEFRKSVLTTDYIAAFKLKGLDPATFNGDMRSWKSFGEAFRTGVDSQPFTYNVKLSYLKQTLKGKTHKAIEGLDTTAENYAQA